jgi:hypothetical protein
VCEELGLLFLKMLRPPRSTLAPILVPYATLLARGFPEASVKKELYWPKGKEPQGATAAEVAANADE